jgi:hypothetical protein
VRSVTATTEGDMDIQGILGIDSDVRNGFGGIKVTYDIDADAKREDIDAPLGMDLASGAIKTIIWATGYRPDYSWLEVPLLDRKGTIRHDGGIVGAPGIYLIGAVFLRRRKSTLIDGAGDDARDLRAHLASYLENRSAR